MEILKTNRVLLALFLIVLFFGWTRYHPIGENDLVVFDDDARQHVYWTAKFQNPNLFPNDELTDFISSYLFDPPGYQFIYRIGTRFMDPLPLSQLLSAVLMLLSVWLLDVLLKGYGASPTARLICGSLFIFYCNLNFVHNVLGGMPRTFAYPLLMGFLIVLQKGHFKRALIFVLFETVIYPPILLNTFALAGADILTRFFKGASIKKLIPDTAFLAALVLAAGLFLTNIYGGEDSDVAGPQVTYDHARQMAEFYPGGRSEFFQDNPVSYYLNGRSGVGIRHLSGFLVIGFVMAAVLGFRKMKRPPAAVHLIWTSMTLFILAHLVLFKFHVPSRYTYYTISLALLLLIGANIDPFFRRLGFKKPVEGGRPSRLKRISVVVLAAVFLLIFGWFHGRYINRIDPRLVVLDPVDMEMLGFIEQLPDDYLIAGHPSDMDNVPLIAKKSVLANKELAMPYFTGYYRIVKERLLAMLEAYYADNWDDVSGFIRKNGVDAVVVSKNRLKGFNKQDKIFVEPFNKIIKSRMDENRLFVLLKPPSESICFENERYIVVCPNRMQDKQ